MSTLVHSLLAVMMTMTGTLAPPRQSDGDTTITGVDLVRRLREAGDGEADVEETDLTVTGTVDLTTLRDIERPLRCRRCTFTGVIKASDVTFRSALELVDVTFQDDVDAHGATFESSVVLDLADFDQSLNLTGVRFGGLVSFEGANVDGVATFDRSVLAGRAVFTGTGGGLASCPDLGGFNGEASFRGVVFLDVALFRQRCFADTATFDGASFAMMADFTLSAYGRRASFERTAFNGGASFAATRFGDVAWFNNASLGGDLVFDRARFARDVVFSDASGTGVLELGGIVLNAPLDDRPPPPGGGRTDDDPLRLRDLTLDGLSMDFDTVRLVNGDEHQRAALALIEQTARARDQTGRANEAHYRLLTRQNELLPAFQRVVDKVFYGLIAGYLVKPWNPLKCLIALLVVGAIARAMSAWRRAFRRRERRLPTLIVELVAGFASGVFQTWRQSWSVRKRPEPAPVEHPARPLQLRPFALAGVRWTEWLAVKVLIAVALLGIANASPTVRNLIESVL